MKKHPRTHRKSRRALDSANVTSELINKEIYDDSKPIKIEFSKTALFTTFLVLILIGGTVAFQFLEDWNFIQSFYFTISTLTTVGYGDLVPTSDGSRLAASIFMLFGIAGFVTLLSLLEDRFRLRAEILKFTSARNQQNIDK